MTGQHTCVPRGDKFLNGFLRNDTDFSLFVVLRFRRSEAYFSERVPERSDDVPNVSLD
jgi:hypothetical protein